MNNKEAIERLKWVQKRICDITYSPESFEAINLAIKALEEKPQGEWIIDGHHRRCNYCNEYTCTEDREGNSIPDNFCPNCGAEMKGDAE